MTKRDILITGYPSFLARRLLDTILEREKDITIRLLARRDHVDDAARRIEELERPDVDIQLLSGDVVSMDLGLSGAEYLDIVEHVTDIYHIASIWYLGVDKQTIHEVNVEGARNVIDAAMEMKNLRRLNHFSTAFVAGDRTGVIMEDELDEGQTFRNAYESTKFEAEKLMRNAMRHIPISVFRPSIIVGDSRNGEIEKMAGPYYIMNAIVLMPPNMPILMPGKGDKPLNMVPVDYVCNAMHSISMADDTASKTFHIADPNPLSARKVFDIVAHSVGRAAPVGRFPYKIAKMVMKFPYLEKMTRSPRQFMDDFNQLTIYNAINTSKALKGLDTCPPFTSYVDHLVQFIKTSDNPLDIEMPDADELLG